MKNKKLNRDSQSRIALFKGQISSLIAHEEITTTAAKATVLKSLFEKMLTNARTGTIQARRQIQSFIIDGALVKKIVDEIAPRYKGVNGGYTKTIMVGNRKGDGAPMVKITLTKKSAVAAPVAKSKKSAKASKAAPVAPKVTTPRVAKPTATAKLAVNKAGMTRKTGER